MVAIRGWLLMKHVLHGVGAQLETPMMDVEPRDLG